MGLVTDLKKSLLGGDGDLTYRFNCRECDTRFESEKQGASNVICPECGNGDGGSISRL